MLPPAGIGCTPRTNGADARAACRPERQHAARGARTGRATRCLGLIHLAHARRPSEVTGASLRFEKKEELGPVLVPPSSCAKTTAAPAPLGNPIQANEGLEPAEFFDGIGEAQFGVF